MFIVGNSIVHKIHFNVFTLNCLAFSHKRVYNSVLE